MASMKPEFRPALFKEPSKHLVLPMPRASLGTVRVEGHTLRVRQCSNCGVYTTIPVCPLCTGDATTSTPTEASLNRDESRRLPTSRRMPRYALTGDLEKK